MIRPHLTLLRLALMIADGLGAFLLFIVLSMIRYGPNWQTTWNQQTALDPYLLAIGYSLAWTTIGWATGLYRLRARWTLLGDLRDVLHMAAIVLVVVLSSLYFFKLEDVGRLFLALLFSSQVVVTALSRIVVRRVFGALRARGVSGRYMLVVGAGEAAQTFADRVDRRRDLGLRVVGHLSVRGESPTALRRPLLGGIDDIESVFSSRAVDEVAICLPPSGWPLIEPITLLCREVGKAVRIPLDTIGLTWPNGRVEEFEGSPILSHVQLPDRVVALAVKRMLDIALSALALVVLSPVFLATAVAIRLADGGPVLFRQVRVGRHGRLFTIAKFRTMVLDAEARYEEVASLSDTHGPAFKMTADPRITRVGRFLRKASIDELPQLWNVLRGEMSLVGPRPAPPREVAGYDIWHRRRLAVRPGITGLWQVEARRDEDFDRRASLDLRYIDQWSVLLDLAIMARTIPALFAGR